MFLQIESSENLVFFHLYTFGFSSSFSHMYIYITYAHTHTHTHTHTHIYIYIYIYIYYINAMEGTIKQRIYNNKLSFKNRNYSSNTSLFSYIWQLKDTNISPTISWEILKQAPAYNRTSRHASFASITKHPTK